MKGRKIITQLVVMFAVLALLAACANNGNTSTNNAGNAGNAGDSGNTANNAPAAEALDWPKQNIELIVPYNAGGVSDILARSFIEASAGIIDASITVKNVGGGSGTVGNYELVKAKPDGYTWLWAATGHISSSLHITEAAYDMDDFTIVNKVGDMLTAVVVPKNSPLQTLQDLVDQARQDPGSVTAGNPGEGTVVALLANMLQQSADIELQHVPFQGSGPLLPAILGGHVDVAFMNVPEVRGQIDAGELRALAILGEERMSLLPDVPTAAEQGVAGVAGGAAHFIIIPNGVPDEVVARINELTKAVYETDRFKELMEQAAYQIGFKNAEDSRQEVQEWYDVTGEIYRSLGLIQ